MQIVRLLSIVTLSLAFVYGQGSDRLTASEIQKMLQAKLPESVIIARLQGQAAVDISTEDLVQLKAAGASETLLLAIANHAANSQSTTGKRSPTGSQSTGLAVPAEVGIYVKNGDSFTMLEPEVIALRTSGFPMFGRNFDGSLVGLSSSNRITVPSEFLIVCPEGTSAAEYQLLRLEVKKGNRDFRALRAGAFGRTKAGNEGNVVAVEMKKLGARTYGVVVNKLGPGEYGWLPPGGANVQNLMGGGGKMYSFRVPD